MDERPLSLDIPEDDTYIRAKADLASAIARLWTAIKNEQPVSFDLPDGGSLTIPPGSYLPEAAADALGMAAKALNLDLGNDGKPLEGFDAHERAARQLVGHMDPSSDAAKALHSLVLTSGELPRRSSVHEER